VSFAALLDIAYILLLNCLSFAIGGPTIYAIIETGGKQYKVTPGQRVAVDHLDAAAGDKIEIKRVLLLSDGEKVTVGTPTVADVVVSATVAEHFKGEKLIVFNYKPKVRYDKKRGHRQQYTRLAIDSITGPGIQASAPVHGEPFRASLQAEPVQGEPVQEPVKEEVK